MLTTSAYASLLAPVACCGLWQLVKTCYWTDARYNVMHSNTFDDTTRAWAFWEARTDQSGSAFCRESDASWSAGSGKHGDNSDCNSHGQFTELQVMTTTNYTAVWDNAAQWTIETGGKMRYIIKVTGRQYLCLGDVSSRCLGLNRDISCGMSCHCVVSGCDWLPWINHKQDTPLSWQV